MRRIIAIVVLTLAAQACWARPLLVPPKHLQLPVPAGTWSGDPYYAPEFGVPAIDGDTVLVGARRAINANNDRIDGVYIFQRNADGNWNYAGPLFEGQRGRAWLNGSLAAVQLAESMRVYVRGAQGWSLDATIPLNLLDYVFRVDDGAIFFRQRIGDRIDLAELAFDLDEKRGHCQKSPEQPVICNPAKSRPLCKSPLLRWRARTRYLDSNLVGCPAFRRAERQLSGPLG